MKKVLTRFFCYLLIITMVFERNAVYVMANQSKKGKEISREYEKTETDNLDSEQMYEMVNTEPEIVQELTEKRDEFSKQYLLSDRMKLRQKQRQNQKVKQKLIIKQKQHLKL